MISRRPRISSLFVGLAIYLAFAGIVLIASAKGKKNAGKATEEAPPPPRVLMIGDSLSVGPFGEAIQKHLKAELKTDNVFAYASCGSSPENWLTGEPDFYTRCAFTARRVGFSSKSGCAAGFFG